MKIVNFAEENSLVGQFLTEMRDVKRQNDPLRFRHNLKRIGQIMAYEISKRLHYAATPVTTPLADTTCPTIDEHIVLATILRAGLPFYQGFLDYFDNAQNAFVSAYRKIESNGELRIHVEYIAAPPIDDKTLILVDPMLATGSSMDLCHQALLTKGTPSTVHLASVIAVPEAIANLEKAFPADTTLWTAAIDEGLNDDHYIVPGLGDAGDLAFGPKDPNDNGIIGRNISK